MAIGSRLGQAQAPELHVLRHTPNDSAGSGSIVTVAFDRPVAGMLGRSVDVAKIVRITPTLTGALTWRDPATIQFVPERILAPGDSLHVEIDTAFQAMDGSRLAAPYRFDVRVPPPKVLTVAQGVVDPTSHFPTTIFRVVVSGALDSLSLVRLVNESRLEAPERCVGVGRFRIRFNGPIPEDADWQIRMARAVQQDTTGDGFRRLIELEPEHPIPDGCAGTWIMPSFDPRALGDVNRFHFNTRDQFYFVARCPSIDFAPLIGLHFSAPADSATLVSTLTISPQVAVKVTQSTTYGAGIDWQLKGDFQPGVTYTIGVSPDLKDVHGRTLTGPATHECRMPDRLPGIAYPTGVLSVSRARLAIPLRYANADSAVLVVKPLRGADRARALTGTLDSAWFAKLPDSVVQRVALPGVFNEESQLDLPLPNVGRPGDLLAVVVRVASPRFSEPKGQVRTGPMRNSYAGTWQLYRGWAQVVLVQPTNLVLHAKVGDQKTVMFVTSAETGRAVGGVRVAVRDSVNGLIAQGTTDRDGLASLAHAPTRMSDNYNGYDRRTGLFIEASRGDDHAVSSVGNAVGPLAITNRFPAINMPLGPYATLFAERGIYRPGEVVHLQAMLRSGMLGALTATKREPVRIIIYRSNYAEPDTIHAAESKTSDFGSVIDSVRLSESEPVGPHFAEVQVRLAGRWRGVGRAFFVVQEYRAPEFSVSATLDTSRKVAGDSVHATVDARYLFGAPMTGAKIEWAVSGGMLGAGAFVIPNAAGFVSGGWTDNGWNEPHALPGIRGVDTIGADGTHHISFVPNLDSLGGMVQINVDLAVTDVNRQVVTKRVSTTVAASSVFLATREHSRGYYWQIGTTDSVDIIAVRPNGDRIAGLPVDVVLLRRDWNWQSGKVVVDTVRRLQVQTSTEPVTVRFSPTVPGQYQLKFVAHDERGRPTMASLFRYLLEPQPPRDTLTVEVTGPRDQLRIGDTATVSFISPFPNAEAWVTVEREQVMEQRRLQVRRGRQEMRIPIRDHFTPNVFVSVILVNRRSMYSTDSLPPLVRTGYTQLTVETSSRRLDVTVRPRTPVIAPGDTAIIDLQLKDHGRAVRGEATLWAVDEGVLALTEYTAPNPVGLIYRPRGMGSIVASGLRARTASISIAGEALRLRGASAALEAVVVAQSQVGEQQILAQPVLRSEFRTTAFYLGHVVSDTAGHAEVRAKMPDNLTTFRLMAVAATDDRFGSASDTLLVTRDVVVRPALPRFARPGDSVLAGATVNIRSGAAQPATLTIAARGVELKSPDTARVNAGAKAAEQRWPFVVPRNDTTSRLGFTFTASARDGQDAVQTHIPVKTAGVPRTHTIVGVVRGMTEVEFTPPPDMDVEHSRITLERAASPLGVLQWAFRSLRYYSYDHSELLASHGRAMAAVYRVRGILDTSATNTLYGEQDPLIAMRMLVVELGRRQTSNGAILYWRNCPFTSAWLTAHVGLFLLEARDLGVEVEPRILDGIARYLEKDLASSPVMGDTALGTRASRRIEIQWRLSERVAALNFFSRFGTPSISEEERVMPFLGRMAWEDRVWFAETIASREPGLARALLRDAWNSVKVAGRRMDLPDSTNGIGDFPSHIRPAARLFTTTLTLDPNHPLLGALMETILQLGRAERAWSWNTQDYSAAIIAAAQFTRGQQVVSTKAPAEIVVSDDKRRVTVKGGDESSPVYFAVTLTEVPRGESPVADDRGIFVERWYERYADGTPVTTVNEGDLVRVRLRITVPSDRQFVAVDDALPAGLEAVDQSLRTSATLGPFATAPAPNATRGASVDDRVFGMPWAYGRWDQGWWTPWEHREMYDDHVLYFARMLWKGRYEMSYIARATTVGVFVDPPARAEEMYNAALGGRSVGTRFVVQDSGIDKQP